MDLSLKNLSQHHPKAAKDISPKITLGMPTHCLDNNFRNVSMQCPEIHH